MGSLLTLCYLVAGLAHARAAFDSIVVFGDSLSDSGGDHGAQALVRLATASDVEYPGAPYYNGSVFSNGPTYTSTVAELLDLPLDDWAVGGATSGALPSVSTLRPPFAGLTKNVTVLFPSALEQAESYIETQGGNISADALYLVFIGGNDLLDILAGANASVTDTVAYIGMTLDALYEAGARSFLVPNSSSLDRLPALQPVTLGALSEAAQAGAHQLVLAYNALLAELLQGFPPTHPGALVQPYNNYAVFADLLENATMSGLDTTTPCFTASASTIFSDPDARTGSVCADPDQHLWWDRVHPTGWVHAKVGEAIADAVGEMATVAF